jgi:uncharacterized membrane protein YgcG
MNMNRSPASSSSAARHFVAQQPTQQSYVAVKSNGHSTSHSPNGRAAHGGGPAVAVVAAPGAIGGDPFGDPTPHHLAAQLEELDTYRILDAAETLINLQSVQEQQQQEQQQHQQQHHHQFLESNGQSVIYLAADPTLASSSNAVGMAHSPLSSPLLHQLTAAYSNDADKMSPVHQQQHQQQHVVVRAEQLELRGDFVHADAIAAVNDLDLKPFASLRHDVTVGGAFDLTLPVMPAPSPPSARPGTNGGLSFSMGPPAAPPRQKDVMRPPPPPAAAASSSPAGGRRGGGRGRGAGGGGGGGRGRGRGRGSRGGGGGGGIQSGPHASSPTLSTSHVQQHQHQVLQTQSDVPMFESGLGATEVVGGGRESSGEMVSPVPAGSEYGEVQSQPSRNESFDVGGVTVRTSVFDDLLNRRKMEILADPEIVALLRTVSSPPSSSSGSDRGKKGGGGCKNSAKK